MKEFEKEGKVAIPDQLKAKICETIEGKWAKKKKKRFTKALININKTFRKWFLLQQRH